jgi:S-adenosylmethionine hydrolase
MPSLVTLLTDFGLQDSYVAEMKAVLLSSTKIPIVDITHDIPAFDLIWGAFQLLRAHAHFPKGTCHVAIVDPGVGTTRKAIYVQTKRYHFVGPDNGVLLWAVQECERVEKAKAKIYEIAVDGATLPTFHGRDVFAPFVVKLLKGKVGSKLKAVKAMQGKIFPTAKKVGNLWQGEILGHDRFGNVITSIAHGKNTSAKAQLAAWREKIESVNNYSEIPQRMTALIRGSHGFWEVACKQASAWRVLNVERGDRVTLEFV